MKSNEELINSLREISADCVNLLDITIHKPVGFLSRLFGNHVHPDVITDSAKLKEKANIVFTKLYRKLYNDDITLTDLQKNESIRCSKIFDLKNSVHELTIDVNNLRVLKDSLNKTLKATQEENESLKSKLKNTDILNAYNALSKKYDILKKEKANNDCSKTIKALEKSIDTLKSKHSVEIRKIHKDHANYILKLDKSYKVKHTEQPKPVNKPTNSNKVGTKKPYKNGCKSFNDNEIRDIRECGLKPAEISKKYGVSTSTIYRILNRDTYTDVI